ncbi:MAG: molybdopterin-dependent oxidoreductase [Vicinamibacteraceae bacterium]
MSEEMSWGKSTVETSCPLDCPDACSLSVSVEQGKVTKIDGSRRHSITKGFICAKVRGFGGRVYGEDRLLFPQIRTGPKGKGQFRQASWNEALGVITSRIDEVRTRSGAEAILPFCYGGSNGLLTQEAVDARFFRRLGASRLARTVCAAPTGAAALGLYGKMSGVAFEDYPAARLIVLWGVNPSASGIHLVPFLREAQRKGATLIVVDPRRTALANQADLHVALRPGTDLPVALALHRFLFDRGLADDTFLRDHATGVAELRAAAEPWTIARAAAIADVDVETLEQFARLYAALSPAVIRCGWGLERNRNGGHAAMAVLGLPAVAGKFGVRGGGYSMSNSGAWRLNNRDWIGVDAPSTRVVNMNQLGDALTTLNDPKVEVLFVYNANPVATIPDQNAVIRGLERADLFTVVFEQVRTDTVAYADVVLPATTFLEHYDINRSYGGHAMLLVKPAIQPVGESRPNADVFSELEVRLGLSDGPTEDETDALVHVARRLPDGIGDAVLADGVPAPPGGTAPIQFVDVHPLTDDRKVHLFPTDVPTIAPGGLYSYQADPATDEHPLALISPASEKTISSTLGELRTRPAVIHMHPADATVRGIASDDAVRVFNGLGEVHCLVEVTEAMRPGTVSLAKGLWRRSSFNQSTATALAPATLSDLGGGACFNDARVEVAKVVAASWEGTTLSVFVPGKVPVQ